MKSIKLNELINISENTGVITFDISPHRLIENEVLLNGSKIGKASITTIGAFKKYKLSNSVNYDKDNKNRSKNII